MTARRFPRWGRFALVVGLVAALTGCTRSVMTLTIEGGTVSGSIVMAVAEDLLTVNDGETVQDALNDWFADLADDPTVDVPGAIDVVDYAEDGYIGRQVNLSGATFGELAERFAAYELSIGREDDMYRFGMVVDLTEHPQLNDDVRRDMEVVVSVTFPGEIAETNGVVDGTTVTWTLDGTAIHELTALAAATPPPPSADPSTSESSAVLAPDGDGVSAAPWIAAGAVLVAAAVVAAVIVLRRRRTPAIVRQDLQATQEIPVIRMGDPPSQ